MVQLWYVYQKIDGKEYRLVQQNISNEKEFLKCLDCGDIIGLLNAKINEERKCKCELIKAVCKGVTAKPNAPP